MSPVNVPAIGAYIREQREQARISLRQLAQATGVSNPYLSQIERGLRKPSADILQQLAKGLRISAEALYVQAGFLEDRPEGYGVKEAVLADPALTERQRQMLLEIYDSFKNETTLDAEQAEESQCAEPADGGLDPAALTWPELAEGHAAVLPDQPVSGQPVLEQAALDQVAAEQAVAEHEQAVADRATASKAAAGAQAPKRATSRSAAGAQAPKRTTSRSASGAQTAPKRAASPAAAAEPASSAASGERTAPRRAASRRAAPKVTASRRAGSKAAGTAEPQSGVSSGNGGRAGRARPSTASTR
jgi:transcriptional regulator with XRE-family HTH domain